MSNFLRANNLHSHPETHLPEMTYAGQRLSAEQIALVQQTVAAFPALSLRELGHTVCEHLGWHTAKGDNRIQLCLGFLSYLQEQGLVTLPAKDRSKQRSSQRPIRWTERSACQAVISEPLDQLTPLRVMVVKDTHEVAHFNELVDRHHYLGYRRPRGPHLRYFVLDCHSRKLGLLLFSYATKSLACRDQWIGWQQQAHKQNLEKVILNSRFLILPWVKVKNLASKTLSLVCRQLADDWHQRHGYRPVLVESFVDCSRFTGSCYRAANWRLLGQTQGRTSVGRKPKDVYVYPLIKDCKAALLCDASPEAV